MKTGTIQKIMSMILLFAILFSAVPVYATATIKSSDKIISLVTCDRYFKRHVGRFIVMAKKLNEQECF